ncbi:MAG: hypothetical protein WC365_06215 [Candidatus Babeliales bacterium]|jgi:hypothetical protein
MKNTNKSTEKQVPQPSQVQQQLGLLNLRLNDFMTQLNAVIKTLVDENQALQTTIAELQNPTKPTPIEVKK